jgi:hypothetical protein
MTHAKPSRKALFKAALAVTEMTAEQFATDEGVTPEHLSYVLNGRRESRSLTEKIDAFIAKHMAGHSALAS